MVVTEKVKAQSNTHLFVKARQKNRKQMLLKRLMLFGLKPSLRMAALKMLMYKKKQISLCDLGKNNSDGKQLFVFIFSIA